MRSIIGAHCINKASATLLTTLCCFVGWPLASGAEPVYKSIDAEGNVTYSATPTTQAVTTTPINIDPAPSAERKQQAIQRQQEWQRSARDASNAINSRREQRAQALEQAKQALEQARQSLAEASVQQTDDWQGKAGGGRHLKASYFARVQQAQAAVELAERNLARARRDNQ
jgi:multidrug resistance efflux pump